MKKSNLSFLALFLVLILLVPFAASCTGTEDSSTPQQSETEGSSSTETRSESDIQTEESESVTVDHGSVSSENESESTEESEITTSETVSDIILEGEHAEFIQYANSLANGVNAYFPNADRDSFVIENQNMVLDYALKHYDDQQVHYIQSKNGNTYIENTMDVFVKMTNGSTFYASKSGRSTAPNLYRMGYYFYEMRLEEQVFATDVSAADYFDIPLGNIRSNDIKCREQADGSLFGKISQETDPYIVFNEGTYSADKYNYLQITLKNTFADTRTINIYLAAGSHTSYSVDQIKTFEVAPSAEYITYYVPLNTVKDYNGQVTKFRLDINAKSGEDIYIKELKVIDAGDSLAPNLSLNRSFYVFSDKMHHRIQVVAHEETADIAEIGMITRIDASTVVKLIVKDGNGEHTSIEDVNWETAEYIGFDIKDTGIFGYILPVDATTGSMTVTLEDGQYVIVQSRTPDAGTITPSELGTANANDFYMGQRIYTDDSHDFTAFLHEADCERNPLKSIKVDTEASDNAAFAGYDALRGVYTLTLDGTNFNIAHYVEPNKYYNVKFTVRGDANRDRTMYFMALSRSGCLETAVLLDENMMLLPIPLEVGKNFQEDGEANIYMQDDVGFGDVVFPLILNAKETKTYTLVDIYGNWGNYPLKQISWIQFHAPYYHLSTGATESNCIMPWYTTKNTREIDAVLPDHRAASAPYWADQPQHTSGGAHSFLEYTDADGNYITSENTKNTIDSYGPTYADFKMDYLSDDGKIEASYIHTEMPQTDENRAYYEMTYKVLEDVTIADFRNDFAFYTVTDNNNTGVYNQFGYLDENNQSQVTAVNTSDAPAIYVLGNECPYFDYFDMTGYSGSQLGYVNLSFLIYNAEFIIGGEKVTPNFAVKEYDRHAALTLNLGEVTLKAGDTFTINAIIMPWGSHESVYDSVEFAPDQNVRDVRADSLLNPLKAEAVADCQVLDSTFLPKLKTTNGKSAEFTLFGGENNVTVRIYGFDMLTAPKVYELIDGEYQEYILSSSKNPDGAGNYQYFDGYGVQYDGDGTYSYSFVTNMTAGAPRTFKIVAEEEFEGWPTVEKIEIPDPIDLYLDPNEIHVKAVTVPTFGKVETASDEGMKYISFYGDNYQSIEAWFKVYEKGEIPTGQYLVMKYRIPVENPEKINRFEFYTSTVDETNIAIDGFSVKNAPIADGEWHVLVIDVAAYDALKSERTFTPDENGVYSVKYLRLDIFNSKVSDQTGFDLAYVGFCDKIEDVFTLNRELSSVMLSVSEETCYYVDKNGDPTEDIPVVEPSLFDMKLDPSAISARFPQYASNVTADTPISENDISYIRLSSKEGGAPEGYFFFLTNATPSAVGQYLTIKYRTTGSSNIEIWSTTSDVYTDGDKAGQKKTNPVSIEAHDCVTITSDKGFVGDGKWQYLVIDLSKVLPNYKADESGFFKPYIMRLDVFGKTTTEQLTFDIAYIGLCDDINDALASEKGLATAKIYDGTALKTVYTLTGEEVAE